MSRQTVFSPCRTYRYALWREWIGGEGYAMFVGLNPSTADETQDDPTIRRCIAFAKAWGYAGLCMTNLFAFRATQPVDMMNAADPIGPDNDRVLSEFAESAGVIVAAWGVHGTYGGRHNSVRALLPKLHYLRLTKDGHPGHPLYLPKTLTPVAWNSTKGTMTDEAIAEPCESIVVTVRNNEGVDSRHDVSSTEEASATVKQLAQVQNHMICVEIDGARTDRWDRERVKDENRWRRTDPDELETLGRIRETLRG